MYKCAPVRIADHGEPRQALLDLVIVSDSKIYKSIKEFYKYF